MSINSSNIDRWLFDYYEGNLSPDDIRRLEQFLRKNPEYYEDAEAWKNAFVEEAVPAFNTTFLVKEAEPANKKKRLAYAALLLLLLSGGTTLFYLSGGSEKTNGASAGLSHGMQHANSHSKSQNFSNTSSNTHQYSNKNNGTAYGIPATQEHLQQKHYEGLSFTPDIEKLENLANQAGSFRQLGNTHAYTYRQQVYSGNGLYPAGGNTSPGQHNTNHTAAGIHNGITPDNNNVNANGYNGQSTYANASVNNNGALLPANNAASEGAAGHNQPVNNHTQDLINSVDPEDINLTIEGTPEETAAAKEPLKEEQGAVKNDQQNKEKTVKPAEERTSELNPDLLSKNEKTNEVKKPAEVNPDKVNIPTSGKGIEFTNRRQVTLLQGINTEFENNASFISQHYSTDAYLGISLTNASPLEKGSGQLLGYSHYIRKARTTINAYGLHNQTGYISQAGLHLQAATQFRINRYQSIIPSLSVSGTRYDFDPANTNTFNGNDGASSYAAGLLTGSNNYNAYNNTTRFNVSAGVLYHHKKFFTGVAVNGLLQPRFKYQVNDRTYTAVNYATFNFVAGTDFISKKYPELSLSPQLNIMVRNLDASFSGGVVARYKSWGAGAGLSTTGAITAYAGYTHRMLGLSYRFMYDRLDAPFNGVNGHYLTAHFNLKSFVKKQKPILVDEK